jgi:hypothetical protein
MIVVVPVDKGIEGAVVGSVGLIGIQAFAVGGHVHGEHKRIKLVFPPAGIPIADAVDVLRQELLL